MRRIQLIRVHRQSEEIRKFDAMVKDVFGLIPAHEYEQKQEELAMGKSSAQRKEFDDLMGELRQQGWVLVQTSNGHWKATPPDKRHTIVHFAISGDPHAFKNTISDLRKRDFQWPPKKREAEREVEPDDEWDAARAAAQQEEDEKVEVTSDEQLQAILAQQEADEHAELEGQLTNGVAAHHDDPIEGEDEEERMERLFKELKDAKTYLTLADSELADREAELLEAQKRRDDARGERKRAVERLRSLKLAFDTEFAGGAP